MTDATQQPQPFREGTARILALLRETGARPLIRVGLKLEGAIKEVLSTPGTGRLYRRGNVTHQASAPGDPPAPDTGTLRRSIATVVEGEGPDTAVKVGTNLHYAAALEFGATRAGRRRTTTILPRPFMRPAFERVRQDLTAELVASLRASVGLGAGPRAE